MLKIGLIFPKNMFIKNIKLWDQLLIYIFFFNFIFKTLNFLKMSPIFVGSVHNFGRSDHDMTVKFFLFPLNMNTWFHAQLVQKIMDDGLWYTYIRKASISNKNFIKEDSLHTQIHWVGAEKSGNLADRLDTMPPTCVSIES